MARQSDKQGTIKTTNPQSVELAGTIGSTSETFTGESRGRYALSTSSSTTIVNAQTLYPELWNRAPAGWQSGSDLVVPAQSNLEYTENIDLTLNDGDLTDVGTEIVDLNFFIVKGFRKGKTFTLGFDFGFDSTSTGANGVDSINIPLSLFPFLNGLTGLSVRGNFVSNTNGLIDGVNSPGVHRTVIGLFKISGSNLVVEFYGDFSTTTSRLATGTLVFTANEDGTEDTPYIHLYDNVSSGALGLPEATADVSGIVDLNQVAVAPINHIINGGDFWQRGTSFNDIGDISVTADYTADRWKGRRSTADAGMNVFRSFVIPPTAVVRNSIAIQRANTSTTEMRICQQIESDRCYQLAGKQVTFGLNYAMAAGATFSSAFIRARYSTTEDESLDVFSGTEITEATKELIISGDLTWRSDSVTFTVPEDCAALILMIDIDPAGASFANDIFYIHEPRLYEGDKLYDYVRAGGSYAGELAFCKRRYTTKTITFSDFVGGYIARAFNTQNLRFTAQLEQAMAKSPSISFAPSVTAPNTIFLLSSGASINLSGATWTLGGSSAAPLSNNVTVLLTSNSALFTAAQYYNVVVDLAFDAEL